MTDKTNKPANEQARVAPTGESTPGAKILAYRKPKADAINEDVGADRMSGRGAAPYDVADQAQQPTGDGSDETFGNRKSEDDAIDAALRRFDLSLRRYLYDQMVQGEAGLRKLLASTYDPYVLLLADSEQGGDRLNKFVAQRNVKRAPQTEIVGEEIVRACLGGQFRAERITTYTAGMALAREQKVAPGKYEAWVKEKGIDAAYDEWKDQHPSRRTPAERREKLRQRDLTEHKQTQEIVAQYAKGAVNQACEFTRSLGQGLATVIINVHEDGSWTWGPVVETDQRKIRRKLIRAGANG